MLKLEISFAMKQQRCIVKDFENKANYQKLSLSQVIIIMMVTLLIMNGYGIKPSVIEQFYITNFKVTIWKDSYYRAIS